MAKKTTKKNYDVKDLALATEGKRRILWADEDMPVLALLRDEFTKKQPLKGMKMSACLHVTAETANLARTLKAGGADLVLCASNPLSTQDDVAASLVKDFKIPVYAICGENRKTYYEHMTAALDHKPCVTMDDGADLVNEIHTKRPNQAKDILASMEETTTGVIRLRAMDTNGDLKFPVFAVNDADCKHMFDNRYGTGQSTLDGIIRATDVLLAGKHVVVAGYGWCGRGVAMRARGMGAIVTITELDPLKALEAAMDGFMVKTMSEAASYGNIFVTLTGNKHVVRPEHAKKMREGAMIANSGHFDVEIDIPGIKKLAKSVRNVRNFVEEITIGKKRIYILGEGRLINLAAAEGHPASVMDMSFAVQAMTTEYAVKNQKKLTPTVHTVPAAIDARVAMLKLKSMDLAIDKLTPVQKKYLAESGEGT